MLFQYLQGLQRFSYPHKLMKSQLILEICLLLSLGPVRSTDLIVGDAYGTREQKNGTNRVPQVQNQIPDGYQGGKHHQEPQVSKESVQVSG